MGPALGDPDGEAAPADLAAHSIIDAHVHLFPDRLFDAVWRWFDEHAWPIRHRLYADQALDFLEARGVRRVVGLHYAHKPGMAADLNQWMLALARRRPLVIPTATVLPGEANDRDVLRRALGEGARGIKIHCHVQKIAPDDARLDTVLSEAVRADVPVVIHAGREPSSPAYGVDTRALCSADRVARLLARHPEATVIVPHLGSDEVDAFEALLDRHPRLYLDTTMMLADYFPPRVDAGLIERRANRLLYGSDFPNLPYAWDRELHRLAAMALPLEAVRALVRGNAERLFR